MKKVPRGTLPPVGWELVPGLAGYMREKKVAKTESASPDLMKVLDALETVKGKDGRDGADGKPGRDGADGKDGAQGLDGPRGPQGDDGKPGRDGKDGAPGKDGKSGKDGKPGKDGAPGKDGKPGKDGIAVGIKDIKSHGSDVRIELTDGSIKQFRLAGGGTSFGGGGGDSGVTLTAGAGIEIDAGTNIISVKRTWTDYVTRWDAEPVLSGESTGPVAGEVYTYVLGGVTRFRLVPTAYTPVEDIFYEAFSGGACSGVIAMRIEP